MTRAVLWAVGLLACELLAMVLMAPALLLRAAVALLLSGADAAQIRMELARVQARTNRERGLRGRGRS